MGRYKEQARQRRGWMVAGLYLAGLCCYAAAYNFSQTYTGYRIRLAIASAVTSYDGCDCDDCRPRYLGISPPRRYGCCPPVLFVEDYAAIWTGAAIVVASCALAIPLVPPLRLQRDPFTCSHCGYDLRGLPGPICPECGQQAEAATEPADE